MDGTGEGRAASTGGSSSRHLTHGLGGGGSCSALTDKKITAQKKMKSPATKLYGWGEKLDPTQALRCSHGTGCQPRRQGPQSPTHHAQRENGGPPHPHLQRLPAAGRPTHDATCRLHRNRQGIPRKTKQLLIDTPDSSCSTRLLRGPPAPRRSSID